MKKALSRNDTTHIIPSLDGWRAIAILGVILCHSKDLWGLEKTGLLYQTLYYGFYGVDLFFGISGFLICSRLLDSEKFHETIRFRDFYIRRVFRILPPYLTYLTVIFLFQTLGWMQIESKILLSCLIFLQNYLISLKEATFYFGHFWSLAVEEHFYLIFPASLSLIGKNFSRRIWVLCLWGLLIAAWRVIEFRAHLLDPLTPNAGFFTRSDIRMDGLIFGALGAIIWRAEGPSSQVLRTVHFFKNLIKTSGAPYLLMAVFGFTIVFQPPLSMLLQAALIPCFLLATTLCPDSLLSRVLSIPPLRWIGQMSYSLYIWNNFFLLPIEEKPVLNIYPLQLFPYNFFALFAVAWISYRWIEKPLIGFGRKLSKNFC